MCLRLFRRRTKGCCIEVCVQRASWQVQRCVRRSEEAEMASATVHGVIVQVVSCVTEGVLCCVDHGRHHRGEQLSALSFARHRPALIRIRTQSCTHEDCDQSLSLTVPPKGGGERRHCPKREWEEESTTIPRRQGEDSTLSKGRGTRALA